ncbi:MAG: hypothetical protein R3C52_05540 [Hyphomonadaceae bacterium]
MGFVLSWAAFQGVEKSGVLARLGLTDTGEPDEALESAFSGADFPGGWYVVVANDLEVFTDEDRLAELSNDVRIVSAGVEEHVMYAAAFEFGGGEKLWSVAHSGADDLMDLETIGDLPGAFAEVRDHWLAEQQGVVETDYIFEIPLQLASALVGFKHDEELPENVAFTRLAR